jgi:hypothetical protein
MSSRGGPAIGDVVVGGFAGLVGPVLALTLGGLGPVLIALAFLARPNVVRAYTGAVGIDDTEVMEPADARTSAQPQREPGGT